MLRWLILILLVYLVYRGIRSVVSELRGTTGGQRTFRPAPPRSHVTVTVHRDGRETTEELVACPRCGVRVPRSRMVAGPSNSETSLTEGVCTGCGKLPR